MARRRRACPIIPEAQSPRHSHHDPTNRYDAPTTPAPTARPLTYSPRPVLQEIGTAGNISSCVGCGWGAPEGATLPARPPICTHLASPASPAMAAACVCCVGLRRSLHRHLPRFHFVSMPACPMAVSPNLGQPAVRVLVVPAAIVTPTASRSLSHHSNPYGRDTSNIDSPTEHVQRNTATVQPSIIPPPSLVGQTGRGQPLTLATRQPVCPACLSLSGCPAALPQLLPHRHPDRQSRQLMMRVSRFGI